MEDLLSSHHTPCFPAVLTLWSKATEKEEKSEVQRNIATQIIIERDQNPSDDQPDTHLESGGGSLELCKRITGESFFKLVSRAF